MNANFYSISKRVFTAVICFMLTVLMIGGASLQILASGVESSLTAAAEGKKTCEVVVLMDVSGSMNTYDPVNPKTGTRVTLESMELFPFAFKNDMFSDITLNIIIYDNNIHMLLEDADVTTKEGKKELSDRIMDLKNRTVEGFPKPYGGLTDIESAMKLAKEKIEHSTADVKAIILFTDGRIQLSNANIAEENAASEERTTELSKELGKMGVPVFCIGLGSDVDRAFLNGLAENTNGRSNVFADKNKVVEEFRSIAVILAGGDSAKKDDSSKIIKEVKPDVPTRFEEDLYGEIIAEANIGLSADVPINSMKITDPNGVVKADVNFKTGHSSVSTADCIVDATSSRATINVKILNPADGTWSVEFYGEQEGTVEISILSYYELELLCDISSQVNIGSSVTGEASVFNKTTGVDIMTKRVYTESVFSVYAKKVGSDQVHTYATTGTEAERGKFNYNLVVNEPGDYEVVFELYNSRFNSTLVTTKPLHVNGATFVLQSEMRAVERGNGVLLSGQILVANSEVNAIPEYLKNANITVKSSGGSQFGPYLLSDWMSKGFKVEFEGTGSYTFTAEITGIDEPITSNSVSVQVNPSVIEKGDGFKNTISGTFNGGFETVLPLDGMFVDSDGDKVTVSVAGVTEGITADVDEANNQLIIRADKTVKGTVDLAVSDGYGAEASFTVNVSVKSMIDTLLPFIITAVVLVVVAVVALIIVKKNSIISFAFSVSMEVGKYTYTYNISNYRYKTGAKPKVMLQEMINRCGLCVEGNEEEARKLFENVSDKVKLSGKPFKKEFTIFVNGKKKGDYRRNSEKTVWVGEDIVIFGPAR